MHDRKLPPRRRGVMGLGLLLVLACLQVGGLLAMTWAFVGPMAQWRRMVAEQRARAAEMPLTHEGFIELYPPAPAQADLADELIAAAEAFDLRHADWQTYDRDFIWTDEPGIPEGARLEILRRAAASQPEVGRRIEAIDDRLAAGARANWPRPRGRGGDLLLYRLLPHLNDQRRLASFQHTRLLAAGADGQWQEAFRVVRQELGHAESLAESEQLVEYLTAAGVETLALRGAERLVTDLSPEAIGTAVEKAELLELIASLLDISHREQLTRALRGDVVMALDAMDGSIDPDRLAESLEQPPGREGMKRLAAGLAGRTMRPIVDNDAAICLDFLRRTIAALDAPTLAEWERRSPSDDELIRLETSPIPHPFAPAFIGSTSRTAEVAYRNAMHRRLVAAGLAVRLYQAEHDGQLPPSLEALVPAYLPSIPRDATAEDAPVQYDPRRGLLWTVGEDRDDDGGASRHELITRDPAISTRQLRDSSDHVLPLK